MSVVKSGPPDQRGLIRGPFSSPGRSGGPKLADQERDMKRVEMAWVDAGILAIRDWDGFQRALRLRAGMLHAVRGGVAARRARKG
jgi:hypothetical protein